MINNRPSQRKWIRTLVTGFGPFGSIAENPSTRLAQGCGRPFRILEVAYAAVDQFLNEVDPQTFDLLVMLGVAGTSRKMRMESVAINLVGTTPDVRGLVLGPACIDPDAPVSLPALIVRPGNDHWEPSADAGDYLCNYIFFRALRRFTGKQVCFVHVPPFESLTEAIQQSELNRILDQLERP